jgi:hypothetical protein
LNKAIPPSLPPSRPTDTGVSGKKVPIHASAPTDETTEKSRSSQPQDQGSPEQRQEKRNPADKADRVGQSLELASRVTDSSEPVNRREERESLAEPRVAVTEKGHRAREIDEEET